MLPPAVERRVELGHGMRLVQPALYSRLANPPSACQRRRRAALLLGRARLQDNRPAPHRNSIAAGAKATMASGSKSAPRVSEGDRLLEPPAHLRRVIALRANVVVDAAARLLSDETEPSLRSQLFLHPPRTSGREVRDLRRATPPMSTALDLENLSHAQLLERVRTLEHELQAYGDRPAVEATARRRSRSTRCRRRSRN